MLVLKNKKDFEILKKYGFKPKYNEDTGELYKFVLERKDEDGELFQLSFLKIINGGYWELCGIKYVFADDVYDLIQDGIVEKRVDVKA